jgi:hypothetical protein
LRTFVLISIALIFLLQPASKLIIAIQFYMNQEYIAQTMCVNRNKPEVLCSGKCVLNNMMEASEESEKQQIPASQKDKIEHWIVSFPSVQELENRAHVLKQEITLKFNYVFINGSAHLNEVVQPPEQA